MNLYEISSIVTLILSLAAALTNCYKIFIKKVEPTLSTWLIFLAGTSLSLASYLATANKDFLASALNSADVVSDVIVIFTTIFFAKNRWGLKPFEKYYLGGLIAIAIFWLITRDAFRSNLIIQVMLGLGYFPTYHGLIKSKQNSESFVVWGLILLSTTISFYPTYLSWQEKGNFLAFIYSFRSFVLISILIALMFKFRKNSAKNT